ncbi:MAG: SDR family NAD(P)-dependent oxidoreductase [Candidatus Omnitrophica bacterium]|nr:SDR family NAD(P)-dependent oxidoreductase [Candidatus Omnitrophota bacterium]
MKDGKKRAVIIGTSTGIGQALARKLSVEGYVVGLAGRSMKRLRELQKELPGESHIRVVDLLDTRQAIHELGNLIMEMREIDLLVINAGVLHHNPDLRWDREEETLRVNAVGFAAMANVGVRYFLQRKQGCIVGISSVAGHRGSGRSPAYNATKAFMMNYMEGLRQRLCGTGVRVVDIRPGFVDTDMIRGRKGLFGVASTAQAADGIFRAIQKNKRIAYVPFWWAVLMWFFKRVPESLYHWGYRSYTAWDGQPPKSS